jgi:hypothetical protein
MLGPISAHPIQAQPMSSTGHISRVGRSGRRQRRSIRRHLRLTFDRRCSGYHYWKLEFSCRGKTDREIANTDRKN